MKRSSLSLWVLLLGWLLSLGVVYILGLFTAFGFHAPPGEGGLADLSSEERAYALLTSVILDEPVEWNEWKTPRSGEGLDPQLSALLIALEGRPAWHTLGARQIAAAMPSRKVGPALESLQTLSPRTRAEEALWQALFERWATIDGRSAVTAALSQGETRALDAALRGWAGHAPEAAWSWVALVEAPPAQLLSRYTTVLVHGGFSDERARSLLGALDDATLRTEIAAAAALEFHHREGVSRAFQFGEAITEDASSRAAVLGGVLEVWTEEQPHAARDWFDRLPTDRRGWALEAIGRGLATRDGAEALTWLETQPLTGARQTAIAEASARWLENDGPAALGEFLNTVPDLSPFEPALERLVLATVDFAPATAFSWSELLADPSRRTYLQLMVAMQWEQTDPEAAATALYAASRPAYSTPAPPAVITAEELTQPVEIPPGETLIIEAPAEPETGGPPPDFDSDFEIPTE